MGIATADVKACFFAVAFLGYLAGLLRLKCAYYRLMRQAAYAFPRLPSRRFGVTMASSPKKESHYAESDPHFPEFCQEGRPGIAVSVPAGHRVRLRGHCQRHPLSGQQPVFDGADCGHRPWRSVLYSAHLGGCGPAGRAPGNFVCAGCGPAAAAHPLRRGWRHRQPELAGSAGFPRQHPAGGDLQNHFHHPPGQGHAGSSEPHLLPPGGAAHGISSDFSGGAEHGLVRGCRRDPDLRVHFHGHGLRGRGKALVVFGGVCPHCPGCSLFLGELHAGIPEKPDSGDF